METEKTTYKGKLTISRISSNIIDDDVVEIRIEDGQNYNNIVTVKTDLKTFALSLLNVASLDVEITHIAEEEVLDNLNKKRIIKEVVCKATSFNKEEQIQFVRRDFLFKNLGNQGWRILHDGTGQRQDSKFHNYTIYKYEN